MKLVIDIPEKVVTAIQNGEDYRYDINTAIALGTPYEELEPSSCVLMEFGKCSYKETGCSDCFIKERIRRTLEERPKGKWEFVQYDANPNIGNWHCTNCRGIAIAQYNFCPTCGAEMRGDV